MQQIAYPIPKILSPCDFEKEDRQAGIRQRGSKVDG